MQLYFYNGQPTNYFITTNGKCKNQKTNRWLKGQISKNGYLTYNLKIDKNTSKRLYAHRMVAETYIPIIKGKTEVNHKDGNKLNNTIENLEWVNSKENKQHALKAGLYDSKLKKVYCFSEDKILIAEYKSISDASRITGIEKSQLSMACNADLKILTHGYYWSFSPNQDFDIQVIQSGKAKKVAQYNLSGKLIKIYNTMSQAARENNCSRPHIGECCNKKLKTYKGYIWKYI